MVRGRRLVVAAVLAALTSCSHTPPPSGAPASHQPSAARPEPVPSRFTIRPDDYHVPYAGTAEDGRRFFLSQELFVPGGAAYVGLFLWHHDGSFDRVEVVEVRRPRGLPPGQAGAAGSQHLVDRTLAELGDYRLEPVDVEPFLTTVDGVRFGWQAGHYDDGTAYLNIEPGDFIAYYAPWDGRDYDT